MAFGASERIWGPRLLPQARRGTNGMDGGSGQIELCREWRAREWARHRGR